MSADRTFKFLSAATVLVSVSAPDEATARAYLAQASGEQLEVSVATRDGHQVADVQLSDDEPDLFLVDGEEPGAGCLAKECDGYLVYGRCTAARCPGACRNEDCLNRNTEDGAECATCAQRRADHQAGSHKNGGNAACASCREAVTDAGMPGQRDNRSPGSPDTH
ncbi:hypothetical protein ACFY0G_17575 [Streptomyces sp. NPDC001552]|uniref:hypothetical protein n=1 Tax=Streptomyces sp. NPDC001552 TaxID=3364587 RepID=UPI00368AED9A